MKEKLEQKYTDFKNILDVMPTNNKFNRQKKLDYILEEEKTTNQLIENIKKEIDKRLLQFSNLVIDSNIADLEQKLEQCSIVNEWNQYNTPYEKMHLDYYLYQLHRYYKEDLTSVNTCIEKIIESFNKVGITLTKEDFDFNNYIADYIEKIINQEADEVLKSTFEEIYWKFPEIIKTIEINEDTAVELLNKFTSNDVVIFTAHGHPEIYEDILKKNNVTYVDATCKKVKECFNAIKEANEVIYIGKNHHPETVAALTMNKNAHLYDITSGSFDYNNLKTNNPLVINQTTLSFLELDAIHNEIKNKLPNAIFHDEICDATLLRQKAIQKIDDNIDTIIIVGSKRSSNTMKLYDIAKEVHQNKQVIMVNEIEQLARYQLGKNVAIASGTSTPVKTIEKIRDYASSK